MNIQTKRIIKFRGQRKTGKFWEYGSLYINKKGETFIDLQDWKREPVKPETVGQFTGLKDKNGKEIYGGDIVINGNKKFPMEVIWIVDHLRFMLRGYAWTQKEGVSHKRKIFTSPSRAGNIEVIGNIYENTDKEDFIIKMTTEEQI